MPDMNFGVLHVYASPTGSGNSGTTETTLSTYTLPGGYLNRDGQILRITAYGTSANNANTKNVRVYFGSTVCFSPQATGTGNGVWALQVGYVVRTGPSSQIAFGRTGVTSGSNEGGNTNLITTPAENMANDIVIKVTGQSSAASNDVLLKGFIVEGLIS